MKGDRLPPEDHIARYCGGSHISEDGHIAPTAFHLRPGEEYVSVQWLEYLKQMDRFSEIREVRRILGERLKMGISARIAVLNCRELCTHVEQAADLSIRVLHEPALDDLSHSGIHDTAQDEDLIAELIVEKILESHPAVEPS